MKVGFIGLGHMGAGMAANLLRAGHEVTVYNRSPGRTQALARQGAKIARSVPEACHGQVVFTMLANDEAVEDVAFGDAGIVHALARDAVHVSSGTISLVLSDRLAAAHGHAGQHFVAAPVFGRPDVAEAGGLFVVAAGAPKAIELASPLFEAIGQKTFVVSTTPRAANLVKLSGNFLIASVIESLGEAMALVGKGGIDRHRYLEILTATLFDTPVYRTYGTLIADATFEPAGFAAALGHKDIRLVLAAAEGLHVPLPIASILRDRFLALLANGGEALDWSAIGGLAAWEAGAAPLPDRRQTQGR